MVAGRPASGALEWTFDRERGTGLLELLIAVAVTGVVVGSAVELAARVQQASSHALHDAAAQQEARVALDWIAQAILAAGSNPYGLVAACPAAAGSLTPIHIDPNGDGVHDDIRVRADVNPPDRLLVGDGTACDEPGEDVTIAYNGATRTITRRDLATDAAPVPLTDAVFAGLEFTALAADRTAAVQPDAVAFVRVRVTTRSRSRHPHTGQHAVVSFTTDVRLRAR